MTRLNSEIWATRPKSGRPLYRIRACKRCTKQYVCQNKTWVKTHGQIPRRFSQNFENPFRYGHWPSLQHLESCWPRRCQNTHQRLHPLYPGFAQGTETQKPYRKELDLYRLKTMIPLGLNLIDTPLYQRTIWGSPAPTHPCVVQNIFIRVVSGGRPQVHNLSLWGYLPTLYFST